MSESDKPNGVPREIVARMLTMVAGDPTICNNCGRKIWFVKMLKSGRLNPFTDEAVSHFADCPAAGSFRKESR